MLVLTPTDPTTGNSTRAIVPRSVKGQVKMIMLVSAPTAGNTTLVFVPRSATGKAAQILIGSSALVTFPTPYGTAGMHLIYTTAFRTITTAPSACQDLIHAPPPLLRRRLHYIRGG